MNHILLVLSYVFGLVPFNRLNDRVTQIHDYLIMVIVPICYLTSYGLAIFSGFSVQMLTTCDSVCRLSNSLFIHLGCFLYTTICFLTLLRRKKFYIEFYKSLQDIDDGIKACQKVASDKMKVAENRHMYYIACLLIGSIFGYALTYDVLEMISYYGEYFFVANMAVTFPMLVGSVAQGQFIYYVSVISRRFKELNYLFNKINNECDKKNAPITIYDIETNGKNLTNKLNKPQLIKPDGSKDKNDLEVDDVDSSEHSSEEDEVVEGVASQQSGPTSESNLPDLFKLHDKILSLSVLTNAEFGLQCVPYMTVCFVITIFAIFLEAKVIFVVGGKNHLLDYIALIYVIWSCSTMLVAYLVLRLCCNANGFSKQSAMIVHEIMQKKPIFMLGNDLYYNKMKSFTLQFLHWEGYFQFNATGLFTLDYTFIFSTVSAATSYLIVLLQFDMSSILKTEGLL